jgi:hypothetical protein
MKKASRLHEKTIKYRTGAASPFSRKISTEPKISPSQTKQQCIEALIHLKVSLVSAVYLRGSLSATMDPSSCQT